MHVRGRPGAHVVIRFREQAPPLELLLLGAQLALSASGIPAGEKVEVSWTRGRHVTKPKRMARGAVLVREGRVLYVEADPEQLGALKQIDGGT